MLPKYKLVNIDNGEILTFGDNNTIVFGGPWGALQAAEKAEWQENVPAPAELWVQLRAERDQRLAACDWTQLPDIAVRGRLTPPQIAAWADYRQALADLPANTMDPASPAWPAPPA